MDYIKLTTETIDHEHICCGFSNKKSVEGYALKKAWLKDSFEQGYVFKRLDERAKVFIEYGPAEQAWVPVTAPHYLVLGCFWVSGKYKGNGHGKALLKEVVEAAKEQGKNGLVAVVGKKKNHFMSDGKWLLRQGFEVCDESSSGFLLLVLRFNDSDELPRFDPRAKTGDSPSTEGFSVYYSNRCPFTEYYVRQALSETVKNRDLKMTIIKLETMEQAQKSPTPATIFSLFYEGQFITTDVSVCMDSRFDKIVNKVLQ